MSSLKANKIPRKKSTLNTTIDAEILNNFKNYCKETGIPMNVILEAFMEQFCDGEFKLYLSRNNKVN